MIKTKLSSMHALSPFAVTSRVQTVFHWRKTFQLLAIEISALLSRISCVNLFSVKGWRVLAFTIIKNYRKCFLLIAD